MQLTSNVVSAVSPSLMGIVRGLPLATVQLSATSVSRTLKKSPESRKLNSCKSSVPIDLGHARVRPRQTIVRMYPSGSMSSPLVRVLTSGLRMREVPPPGPADPHLRSGSSGGQNGNPG